MTLSRVIPAARLVVGWLTVVAFIVFDAIRLAESRPAAVVVFVGLLGVIVWCAFGVVQRADHLAELLGEPLGTLILTLAIVTIEVALISALMLGGANAATSGRDTMFALLMIILNGVVGLALLTGGWRHHQQDYNLQGAAAYLSVIAPLSVVSLVLPNFTRTTPGPTLSSLQAFFFALFTILLYGVFLGIQTVRHRHFFVEPRTQPVHASAHDDAGPATREVARTSVALVFTVLPVILLAKPLAKLLDRGLLAAGAPVALGGMLVAVIVFAPEGLSALRAAFANQLQRAVNLCLGGAASTIGLTVPAVLAIGLITGQPVVLGLDAASMVLLAVTLMISMLTFSGSPTTTVLEGAVHLVLFLVYVVLIFSP